MKKLLLLTVLLGFIAAPALGQNALGTIGPGAVPCAYTDCKVKTLAIGGATLGTDALAVTGTATIAGPLAETSATTNTFNGSLAVGGTTVAGSVAYLYRGNDNANVELYNIGSFGWSSTSSPSVNADLSLWRASTGVMEIGNTTTAGAQGSLLLTNLTGSGAAIKFTGITTGTNADFVCYKADGTLLIQASACTISSMRFKDEIKPYRLALSDAVYRMPVVTFRLKDQSKNPDPNSRVVQMGLIAENVAKIMPLCAIYENDMKTPKSYRQECLVAALVKTVQEQHAANDSLARRVAVLERRR